jgi:malonyl-CoA/methylmalonyl-CoA synthetase
MSSPDPNNPVAWLDAVIASDPGRTFLRVPGGRSYSWQDLSDISGRLATALERRGVRVGDRVAVQVEKSPEALMLYMGCLRLGAVFVPLNQAYTIAELDYYLGDAQPHVAVVRPHDNAQVTALARRCGVAHVETLGMAGEGSLIALASDCGVDAFTPFSGTPDDLAALLYTSGTTGRSKGAMITRRNLASNAAALVEAWRFTRDDVLLHALPIFHTHGLFIASNTVLAAGASMLFLPRFDADEAVALLPQATVLMGVPTFYTRLVRHEPLTREVARHMRVFISGSAPLLAETHRAFEAKTGHAILERYAMTETVVISTNPYDGKRLPGSVGFPLRDVDVRITALETGEVLNDAEAVGMIEVRGPNLFHGYWRNPEKTKADMREDGYFITGDIGKYDAEGYLHIVGRSKDLIITGGYNVYPKEVELEIDTLPGVEESAVIGVPHPDFGEAVTAVVIARSGCAIDEARMLSELRARLANYKVPKRVLLVDEFPRNALGKVQKNILRQRYEKLYCPQQA